MSLQMIPVQVVEITEGGFVVAISYQKGKKGNNEMVKFSKYAETEEKLGEVVSECIHRWMNRHDEE